MARMTTGALARQAGVNLESIRLYERQGLLPKSLNEFRKVRHLIED